jgi:hypothetical protein
VIGPVKPTTIESPFTVTVKPPFGASWWNRFSMIDLATSRSLADAFGPASYTIVESEPADAGVSLFEQLAAITTATMTTTTQDARCLGLPMMSGDRSCGAATGAR